MGLTERLPSREVPYRRLGDPIDAEGLGAHRCGRRGVQDDGGAVYQQRQRFLHREPDALDVSVECLVEVLFGD